MWVLRLYYYDGFSISKYNYMKKVAELFVNVFPSEFDLHKPRPLKMMIEVAQKAGRQLNSCLSSPRERLCNRHTAACQSRHHAGF